MYIQIDLNELVLQLAHGQQLELALYLLDGLFCYTDMFLDDGSDLQYRRLLAVKNLLEVSINSIRMINPDHLALGDFEV
jgi:hypothetical protein